MLHVVTNFTVNKVKQRTVDETVGWERKTERDREVTLKMEDSERNDFRSRAIESTIIIIIITGTNAKRKTTANASYKKMSFLKHFPDSTRTCEQEIAVIPHLLLCTFWSIFRQVLFSVIRFYYIQMPVKAINYLL